MAKKCLTLIINQVVKHELVERFLATEAIDSFTISNAEGYSRYPKEDPNETMRNRVEGFMPRAFVHVLIDEKNIKEIINLIEGCSRCREGKQGRWWISDVQDFGYL